MILCLCIVQRPSNRGGRFAPRRWPTLLRKAGRFAPKAWLFYSEKRSGPGNANQSNNTTGATIPNPHSLPSSISEIDVTHVTSGPSFVSFSGPAGLPDGTVLLSALYEDDRLLPWWPSNQPIKVENGKWEVKVLLGVNGTPYNALRSGPLYVFVVWRKDNPASLAGQQFDLVGPPPP